MFSKTSLNCTRLITPTIHNCADSRRHHRNCHNDNFLWRPKNSDCRLIYIGMHQTCSQRFRWGGKVHCKDHPVHVFRRRSAPHSPIYAFYFGGALPATATKETGWPSQHLRHTVSWSRSGSNIPHNRRRHHHFSGEVGWFLRAKQSSGFIFILEWLIIIIIFIVSIRCLPVLRLPSFLLTVLFSAQVLSSSSLSSPLLLQYLVLAVFSSDLYVLCTSYARLERPLAVSGAHQQYGTQGLHKIQEDILWHWSLEWYRPLSCVINGMLPCCKFSDCYFLFTVILSHVMVVVIKWA